MFHEYKKIGLLEPKCGKKYIMQWYGFFLIYVQPIAEMIAVTLVCPASEQFLVHLENNICEMIIS